MVNPRWLKVIFALAIVSSAALGIYSIARGAWIGAAIQLGFGAFFTFVWVRRRGKLLAELAQDRIARSRRQAILDCLFWAVFMFVAVVVGIVKSIIDDDSPWAIIVAVMGFFFFAGYWGYAKKYVEKSTQAAADAERAIEAERLKS